jgi:glycosyltransferase involved in cell wall biosynthesis
MRTRLVVVVSGFPRTSETFAVGELVALARSGMLAAIYATKPGDGAKPQPGVEELIPLLRQLPPGDAAQQAAVLAADIGPDRVNGVHGYFAHRPADVAMRAAQSLGVGFSFSVHALDARKVAAAELADRARNARGVIACNVDVAQHVDVSGARVRLLPHGVDLARFIPRPHPEGDGRLRVLAVGRLVEKKGFPTLVEAAASVEIPLAVHVIGTGAEQAAMERMVQRHDLHDRVQFLGRRSHDELSDHYAWAHVVAVPSIVDRDGDRDGLPNVALEAMACGRPLVASDVSALGPAVRHAGAGIVVPPGDAPALAGALHALADPVLRVRLGSMGRSHVERHFDVGACSGRLVEHLDMLHAGEREAVDA